MLRQELLQAGFGEPEVDRALTWLDDLNRDRSAPSRRRPGDRSVRVFNSWNCRASIPSAAAT